MFRWKYLDENSAKMFPKFIQKGYIYFYKLLLYVTVDTSAKILN